MNELNSTIVVDIPVSRVFRLWKNFEVFPKFMKSVKSVKHRGGAITHWEVEGPMGFRLQWDAVTTAVEENRLISWESIGGDLHTGGKVRFRALSERQTEVTVTLFYESETLTKRMAILAFNPASHLDDDLQRFKTYAEHREM